jgi:hypothetical protein
MMSQETQVEINPSANNGKLEQLSREINESQYSLNELQRRKQMVLQKLNIISGV